MSRRIVRWKKPLTGLSRGDETLPQKVQVNCALYSRSNIFTRYTCVLVHVLYNISMERISVGGFSGFATARLESARNRARKRIQEHWEAASGHNKLPFRCSVVLVIVVVVAHRRFFRHRESGGAPPPRAETDLLRPRVHRPYTAGRFAKVQVETDVGQAGLEWCRSTSSRPSWPLSMRTRAAHRARLASDQSAPFSTRRRVSERESEHASKWASERANARARAQVTVDRYIIFATELRACLTVHRSRRALNSTLFARCITYFVIAHFVRRANRHTGTSSFRNGLRALADDERASEQTRLPLFPSAAYSINSRNLLGVCAQKARTAKNGDPLL